MRKTNFKKKDFEVFWDFIIRYYELDPQGIVHNSNHAAFYDQATLAYFKYIDYDYESEVELTGKDFHTVHQGVRVRNFVQDKSTPPPSNMLARLGVS